VEFVYEHTFARMADELLSDDMLQHVESELIRNPRKVDVIVGANGARKLRVAFSGRGKSGSGRVIYIYIEVRSRIHFLQLYAKNTRPDITEAEKRELRMLAQRFKEER
jgi:hypothetical protein